MCDFYERKSPSLVKVCKMYTSRYLKYIKAKLDQDLENPRQVCVSLGVCPPENELQIEIQLKRGAEKNYNLYFHNQEREKMAREKMAREEMAREKEAKRKSLEIKNAAYQKMVENDRKYSIRKSIYSPIK